MAEKRPTSIHDFFETLPSKFDAEAAENIAAVYQFDLSGSEGGQYFVEIADGACAVQEGSHPDPHVILSMSGEDCLRVLNGQLDGSSIVMSGRLRISGDLGLALQLKSLFPSVR